MAPRKEKPEKVGTEQTCDLILNYLRKQNRPYSATDISANLHNAVNKVNAAKTLKEMHERGDIEGKAAGKQLVYHAKQDPNDFMSPEELTAMDQEIESVRSDIVARKAEQKVLQATCNVLKSTPTTDALRDSVSALEAEKDSLEARLRVFRSGDVAPVNVEGKEKAERALRTMQRQAGNRKKIFWELWAMVTENQPEGITKEDLWEQLGLEADA